MKKEIPVILLCSIFLFAGLSACQDSNTSETMNPSESVQMEADGTVQPSNGTESGTEDYLESGFKLAHDEMEFVLNNALTDKDVVSQFGEPEQKSEATVWGSDGLEHQTWFYKSIGIEIDFVRNEDNTQVTNSVRMDNRCTLKTNRNIGIGSTKKDVLKAYEKEINTKDANDPSYIVAGTQYGGVMFEIENDLVSSIFIGAAAE